MSAFIPSPLHDCDLPAIPSNYEGVTCTDCGQVWRVDRTRGKWTPDHPFDLLALQSRAIAVFGGGAHPKRLLPEDDYLDLIEEVRRLRAHVHEHVGGVLRHSHDGQTRDVAE